MANSSAIYQASSSRPLPLRMRADLHVDCHVYQGRQYWVVKDPIALKYYRFEDEEFALLRALDGRSSLLDLQETFERRHAPQRITLGELQQFLGMLYRSALVVSDAPDQGRQLWQRHCKSQRRSRWSAVSNILCIRLKGIDPDRFLGWLDQRVGWLFSRWAFALQILLAGTALLLLLSQFAVFKSRLPAFQQFFGPENWFALALTLCLTKIAHEIGHGLSCKRFGGECHEMGVMFLVLTPCLYCNVSDSWMLPSKWQRAAIGAAGMYVEILLASLATFAWWFTEPGWIHYSALNVMFICSVSTLLFNANPLLRYDGYYILSDLLEIPNLRQKATTLLHRKLSWYFLGIRPPVDPFLPARWQATLALYSVAAAVYRWVIAISILWFLHQIFQPYGLQILGHAMVALSLYGLLVHPVVQVVRFFRVPGRVEQVKKARLIGSLTAVAGTLALILLVPFPYYITAQVQVQPRQAASVYVEVPGRIQRVHARPGQILEAGAPLLTLESVEARNTLLDLEGTISELKTRLLVLRKRALRDEAAALEIDQVHQAIESFESQLAQRKSDLEKLQIKAPTRGLLYAPPRRDLSKAPRNQLRTWQGQPFDTHNQDAFLAEGTLVGRIGLPGELEAVLAIDQDYMDLIHPGQEVEFMLQQDPTTRYYSRIEHVGRQQMRVGEQRDGDEPADADTQPALYQASCPFHSPPETALPGAAGQAKVWAGKRTLAQRWWKELRRTLRL